MKLRSIDDAKLKIAHQRLAGLQFHKIITKAVLIPLLAMVSQAGTAALPTGNLSTWYQDSKVTTVASVSVDDDFTNNGPIDIPPFDTEPEPQCNAESRTYTVDNNLIDELAFLLSGSRLQISHTAQGVPIVGEPRTINFARGITASKFELLERAQEQICAGKPNAAQCMADWYQRMSETVVYTIQPEYHSYVDWPITFESLTGLGFTPVPVPIVEKSVQSSVAKAVTSLFILPIAVNVDRARCHVNQIESTFDRITHPVDIRNGRLELEFPLQSAATPTLKCEGRAVALWGLHTWGWSDDFFPDVSLSNMKLSASFGDFRVVDDLPMFSSVNVQVEATVDLNNIPGVGESIISFFKDYSGKARNKVAEALRKKLISETVREAFGRALVSLVENDTGDQIERVCSVQATGETVDIGYETVPDTVPALNAPVRFEYFGN